MYHFKKNDPKIIPRCARKRTKVTTGRPVAPISHKWKLLRLLCISFLFYQPDLTSAQPMLATSNIPSEYVQMIKSLTGTNAYGLFTAIPQAQAAAGTPTTLSIIDLSGTVVFKQDFLAGENGNMRPVGVQDEEPLKSLADGIYICSVDVGGKRFIRKFILEKN